MSYTSNNINPGERLVYKARVHKLAYIYPVLMFAAMAGIRPIFKLSGTELALTDKRVVGKVGIKHLDLPYAAIATVKARQGLFGKLFDYGSVTIVGNDDSRVIFHGIAEPVDVQIQIEEAIEMAVLGRKLSQVTMEKW